MQVVAASSAAKRRAADAVSLPMRIPTFMTRYPTCNVLDMMKALTAPASSIAESLTAHRCAVYESNDDSLLLTLLAELYYWRTNQNPNTDDVCYARPLPADVDISSWPAIAPEQIGAEFIRFASKVAKKCVPRGFDFELRHWHFGPTNNREPFFMRPADTDNWVYVTHLVFSVSGPKWEPKAYVHVDVGITLSDDDDDVGDDITPQAYRNYIGIAEKNNPETQRLVAAFARHYGKGIVMLPLAGPYSKDDYRNNATYPKDRRFVHFMNSLDFHWHTAAIHITDANTAVVYTDSDIDRQMDRNTEFELTLGDSGEMLTGDEFYIAVGVGGREDCVYGGACYLFTPEDKHDNGPASAMPVSWPVQFDLFTVLHALRACFPSLSAVKPAGTAPEATPTTLPS